MTHGVEADKVEDGSDPDVPVLELLSDQAVPDAAAPLLVTAHGRPLGVLPLDTPDPRSAASALFAEELRSHREEGAEPTCTWMHALGSHRPAVTVVVATTGDRPRQLRVLIEALLAQSYAPLQVMVVDNRPGSWSREDALVDHPDVSVHEESRRGVSAARNSGLAAATTPVVLYLDDDVIPGRDWAGWLTAALFTTPETACATGLILPLETRTAGQRLLEEWGGFAKGFVRKVHRYPSPEPQHPLYPYLPGLYGSGANAGFRADALRALGGYDEVLGAGTLAHGGEDLAVQMNVVVSGYDLVYEPGAVVWHRHRASEREWTRQLFWYGTGLCAAMLQQASRSGAERRAIIRRVPAAAVHAFSSKSVKNAGRSADYPKKLVVMELLGLAWGPVALWRSRRLDARSRRGTP